MVRAKFALMEIHDIDSWGHKSKKFVFQPQYDESIEEDRRFAKASPTGRFEITVDNPAAVAQFELGKQYYVDFTKVD